MTQQTHVTVTGVDVLVVPFIVTGQQPFNITQKKVGLI